MPFHKISITLPDDLASQIDHLAAEDGVSRSFIMQEAAARYIVERRAELHEQERQDSVMRAIEGFRELQRQWGPDERSGLDYLDEIRGETLASSTEADRKRG